MSFSKFMEPGPFLGRSCATLRDRVSWFIAMGDTTESPSSARAVGSDARRVAVADASVELDSPALGVLASAGNSETEGLDKSPGHVAGAALMTISPSEEGGPDAGLSSHTRDDFLVLRATRLLDAESCSNLSRHDGPRD